MNFEQGWYVPALRWKQGEKEALGWLGDSAKSRIMPLIELIPKNFKNAEGKRVSVRKAIAKFIDELGQFWGDRSVFVDLHNVVESGIRAPKNQSHLVEMLSTEARRNRPLIPRYFSIVPVTSLARSSGFQLAIKSVAKTDKSGVCLRLTPGEILDRSFVLVLQKTLEKIEVDVQDCDLVIDAMYVTEIRPLQEILDALPQLPNWRTVTFLGGAFPKDLQEYEKDSVHKITRNEWFYFREQIQLLSQGMRLPVFGDYTVQHAIYSEPPEHCNPSASIRYAHEDYWVIMRGHGLTHKGSLGNDQYLAEAQLLCGMDEYCGDEFSKGDDYINSSWKNEKKGTPMTWIRAGINHHMEFVSAQVQNFAKTPRPMRPRAKPKLNRKELH